MPRPTRCRRIERLPVYRSFSPDDAGIRLYGGVQGSADEAAKALAEGRLNYDPDARCDHHEHHGGECGHGSCADHHCHGN